MRPLSRSRRVSLSHRPQLPIVLAIHALPPTQSMMEADRHAAQQPRRGMSIGPWMDHCVRLWEQLEGHDFGFFFRWPVNADLLQLEDYWRVVPRPMDLETIRLNLRANKYRSPEEFDRDVRLMLDNARRFNATHQEVMERITDYADYYAKQRRLMWQFFRNEELYDERKSHVFGRRTHEQKLEKFRRSFFTKKRLRKLGKKLMRVSLVQRCRLWRTMIRKFPDLKTMGEKIALSKFTTIQLIAFLRLCRKIRHFINPKDTKKRGVRRAKPKARGIRANPRRPDRQTSKNRPKQPTRPSRQTRPNQPTRPSRPNQSTRPSPPSRSSRPARPAQPTQPSQTTKPSRPTRPPQPVQPIPRRQEQEESSFEIEDD